MARNILAVWDSANVIERANGLEWYNTAHRSAKAIGARYGLSVDVVATVIAILSPGNLWERNINDAANLIDAHVNGRSMESVAVSTYNQNKKKACSYLAGTLANVWTRRSRKTHAFAALIVDPTSDFVCIDGHAYNIALGECRSLKSVPTIGLAVYATLTDAYRMAAADAGVIPQQMQAVTWVAWHNK